MTQYNVLFRVRQQGAIGAFTEYRNIGVHATPEEPLVDVIDRAGAELRLCFPDVESGGVARVTRDGVPVRPQFLNH